MCQCGQQARASVPSTPREAHVINEGTGATFPGYVGWYNRSEEEEELRIWGGGQCDHAGVSWV